MTSATSTLAYFNSQVCEFRTLMGNKTFWASPKAIAAARKAIGVLYLALNVTEAEQKQAAVTLQATLSEFMRRAGLMGVEV